MLALVLACGGDRAAHDETKVEIVPALEQPTTPVAAPSLPQSDPAYELWVGPVVSQSDPRLVDALDRVPIGLVGIALRLAGPGTFAITEIEVTLAMSEPNGTLAELARSRSPLAADEDIFYKSWQLSQPGTYQVTVTDPSAGAVLAARRFEVASDAATKRVRTPVSPPFQLTVGPATSPTDPKPVKTETKVPIGYVGMRFAPPPDGKLTTPRIEVTLWSIEGETRVLDARKVSTLGAADEVFYKSWELETTGIYEIEVADPDSPTLFATTRFETIPAVAP